MILPDINIAKSSFFFSSFISSFFISSFFISSLSICPFANDFVSWRTFISFCICELSLNLAVLDFLYPSFSLLSFTSSAFFASSLFSLFSSFSFCFTSSVDLFSSGFFPSAFFSSFFSLFSLISLADSVSFCSFSFNFLILLE